MYLKLVLNLLPACFCAVGDRIAMKKIAESFKFISFLIVFLLSYSSKQEIHNGTNVNVEKHFQKNPTSIYSIIQFIQ